MDQALRVVGGTEALYGAHPWLVSPQGCLLRFSFFFSPQAVFIINYIWSFGLLCSLLFNNVNNV